MEHSQDQPSETEQSTPGTQIKLETKSSCDQHATFATSNQDNSQEIQTAQSDSAFTVKAEHSNETRNPCEAMDTNNNNNAAEGECRDGTFSTPTKGKCDSEAQTPNKSESRMGVDSAARMKDLRAKQMGSGSMRSFISSQHGLITPEFRSRTETPTSSSQLLTLPSSALFALEGLEFNSPMGSGQFSPIASARIGRKRQLSVSPLSSSSIDLNSLIRTSPTSLVNYITNSRSSSAGSIGHLSPSFFSNPALFQTPHGRPLQVSLRNAGYPLPSNSGPRNTARDQSCKSKEVAIGDSAGQLTDIKQEKDEDSQSYQNVIEESLPAIKMEGTNDFLMLTRDSAPLQTTTTLETVREESVGALGSSEDEGRQTDITDYSSAVTEADSELDSKKGILDNKSKRVYYNYPSVEDPHNNQCKWADCTHQCDKLDSLVRHVNNEHIYRDSRKEFVCYWNGCVREKKPFKAQYMLLVHMRRHTGEKPHRCTYEGCNKAYSRLENLKTHLRSHTGERPYLCKFEGCGKAFSNASDCAKHMNRTHTDEKPYACPNPGCSKRYTDPSSRRKHVKNCQVNKRARTGDPNGMPGADEESADVPTTKSSSSNKKAKNPRKSDKRKANVISAPSTLPTTQLHSFNGHAQPTSGAVSDHGYFSGGSQGYNSSQLSYNSISDIGDEEISHILQQQRLSDPSEVATSLQQPGYVPTNQVGLTGHVTDQVTPNVRASRQNGGGLTMPAGSVQLTPPPSHFQPSQHIHSPTYPSSHTVYSHLGLPRNVSSNQPANSIRTARASNLATSHDRINPYTNGRHTTSTGYSTFRSYSPPKAGISASRKSPSDDSSVISSSLRSSIMTNSYSTFSSNSSRVSSPCSNSGRSDMLRPHPPVSPRFNQTGFANTNMSLHAQVNRVDTTTGAGYPLKQAFKMTSSFPPNGKRHNSDTRSERSWQYSSQSSRYSFSGSELSDDLLESLPASTRRDSHFAKKQPLPFPESMQDDFIGMECGNGPVGENNEFMGIDMLSSQQNGDTPSFLSSVQTDNLGQSNSDPTTLPLHHLDGSHAMDMADANGFSNHLNVHGGLFSQEAPNDDYDMIFTDLPSYTASTGNMMVGDMSSFATTLSEESRYLEQLLSSQVK